MDRIVGRVAEAIGKLTGNRTVGAKGKAARGRGGFRRAKGGMKRRAR